LIACGGGCENAFNHEVPARSESRGPGLIVACSTCGAKYRYEEGRFEGKPRKKIRCTKCEAVFEIANPIVDPPAKPEFPANPPPVSGGEVTFTRRLDSHDYREHPGEATREHVVSPSKAPHSQNLRLPVGKKLSLAVISGPDSGTTFPVDKARMVIGRLGADIGLSDVEISREHAAVEVEDDSVVVFDLGSTNGTYVGGDRVESAPLDNYGEFEVGGTTLMLIVTGTA
jgi:hypothetical protein